MDDELYDLFQRILPDVTWGVDNEGQIVIYTGLTFDDANGDLVEWEG